MPRVSTVEKHPRRTEIEKAIIDGVSYRKIANQFQLTEPAIFRYVQAHLIPKLSCAVQKESEKDGASLLSRIEAIIERLQKMYDACDDYLRDPRNPDTYYLGPRSTDIDVVYRAISPKSGKSVFKRESLAAILKRMKGERMEPYKIKFKETDPRSLIIHTAGALSRQLELIAKIQGHITQEKSPQITINNYWGGIQAVILKATEGYPEIKEKIISGIQQIQDKETGV